MKIIGTDKEIRVFRELLQQFDPNIDFIDEKEEFKIIHLNDQIIITSNSFPEFKINDFKVKEFLLDQKEKIYLYKYLAQIYHKDLDWGILTGVKPVKLFRKIEKQGYNPKKVLKDTFFINNDKINILDSINSIQKPILNNITSKDISIYLGIPMCPTKCSYCSFVTTLLDKKRILLDNYLKNLEEEIKLTSKVINENNLNIKSFYIGGGTPSILNSAEAEKLLNLLFENFDLTKLKEFSFEAGRPDTTSKELLKTLKNYDITRICLNPQTMNEETLKAINRPHSSKDIIEKYYLMRDLGFNNINMDLIIGLNNEKENQFLNTLDQIIDLGPENLTIHHLSKKKGSKLKELTGNNTAKAYSKEFYNTLKNRLSDNGYDPYYMYRQKYTIGNGENIGYSKKGFESYYNISMMAEEESIIGLGAGSSGKLYNPKNDSFSHVFTVKDIKTYNDRANELIDKKLNSYITFFNTTGEK